MAPSLFVMPILAFLVGLISLFVDPKDPKKRKLIYALWPTLALTCVLQIYFSNDEQKKAGEKEKQALEAQKRAEANLEDIKLTIHSIQEVLVFQAPQRVANILETSKGRPQEILKLTRQSSEAHAELTKIISLPASQRQGVVTVQYFPKDIDRDKVEAALTELGFRLEPGTTQVPDVPTNSIWFGPQVNIDDVKQVAYVLIRAGVQIKAIRSFRNPSRQKASLIQVGADRTVGHRPPLTVDEIRNARDFPRDL